MSYYDPPAGPVRPIPRSIFIWPQSWIWTAGCGRKGTIQHLPSPLWRIAAAVSSGLPLTSRRASRRRSGPSIPFASWMQPPTSPWWICFYRLQTTIFAMGASKAGCSSEPSETIRLGRCGRGSGGLQTADVGQRILRELTAFREFMNSLDSLREVRDILDMHLLHRCLNDPVVKVDPSTAARASQILLRGLGVGLFLRHLADSHS